VLNENHPTNPINPYGRSKLMVENIMKDLPVLNFVTLRYFNVAGAAGEIGEDHTPESHLIPNVLKHLQGKTDHINVYGHDHPTPDGTCIRDYIHVSDLSNAHILALEYLLQNEGIRDVFNLGNEKGYSVLEIIHACENVTQKKANVTLQARRPGDPPLLVASSEKIKSLLGWKPKYTLEQIIETAWNWHEKHPDGY
jgi:UDP-glucose 4-epimerase